MRGSRLVLVAASLAGLATPGDARAEEIAACMTAHEHGQELRLANRWLDARRLFLACAQPSCPALIVSDCTRWEVELAQHIPSVLVTARHADGTEVDDVSLAVDGATVGARLPVVPIPLDPGEHVLRFVHGGDGPVETRVTLRDGEHGRRVEVRLEPTARPPPRAAHDAGAPVAAYAAIGLGGVAAVTSGVLLALGKVDEHDLASSACGRSGTCSEAQVAPIRTDYVVAGVVAGVAAIALGLGVWQLFAHAPPPGAAIARGLIAF